MAQKGYLLFILDNAGSEKRGMGLRQVTFRHLGDNEVKDQMQGVEYLKSLPYVDADRLGVHGWSFGGFMTINLMTTHPDVFKVGVAGGPVIDWKWYEVMYGERYMDTPQANPTAMPPRACCPRPRTSRADCRSSSSQRPVVVPQPAFSFLKQCIQDGTQPDFLRLSGEPHNMRGTVDHMHERISRYFDDYLK
jgi:dipeptidyl-peptidase-4